MILLKPYTVVTLPAGKSFWGYDTTVSYIRYDGTTLFRNMNLEEANMIAAAMNGAYNEGRISTLNYPFDMDEK